MKIRNLHVPVASLMAGALTLSAQAQNQAGATALPETVVAATRTEQPLTDLVADVTVIDRAQIERSGATGVADVLARVPGVELGRNGGPGTSTSVFIRGAETRYTAVYIDGVRVDTQSASGGATWEAIPLAQIERVEVVRGPASAVYGSDAMGGVIQIFTRKGQGPFTPYVAAGLGTYGTSKTEAGLHGRTDSVDYALGVADELSSGFNARPVAGQNPDDDGYRQQSARARLGLQLAQNHRLEANALSSYVNSQYDSASANDDRSLHRLIAGGVNWQARWSEAYSTRLGVTDSRVHYETAPSVYLTDTALRGYLFQNEYRLGKQQYTAALERREDRLDNAYTTPASTDRSQNGLALGYGWIDAGHSLQLQARQDHDSEFGVQNNGSAAYGYAFASNWKATASVGSAFRAPTLFQRFSVYGSPSLQPETSVNQEVGLRYARGTAQWGLVTYHNRVANLITFAAPGPCASAFGCYANTAEAEYTGVTLSARERVGEVNLQASLDVQDPRDKVTGNLLARRASHHGNLSADTYWGAWLLGAGVQLSGARYDNAANTVVLPAYALFNLYASTRLGRDWTLLARIDNLTDTSYQLANGYATAGRSLYVGMRWEPAR